MKQFLFITMMLLAGIAYGGGSEVPWPLSAQEFVYIEDLNGVWMSKTTDQDQKIYRVQFKEVNSVSTFCPYLVELQEIDRNTNVIIRQGSSTYCLRQPRLVTFVMYDNRGEATGIVTFVGVRKEGKDDAVLGSQYVGMTVFSYDSKNSQEEPERVLQDILYKFSL